ncbi:MAG: hypothetical protein ACLGQH_11630 [Acidobacteriota bacterium]
MRHVILMNPGKSVRGLGHARFFMSLFSVCLALVVLQASPASARVLARVLAAVSGVSLQPVAAALSRDDTPFFADEIAGTKAVIDAQPRSPGGGPSDCASLVPPFLDANPSVIAATAAAGSTAARTGYGGSYARGGFSAGVAPGGYDTLAIWAERPGDIFGRFLDPATLARRVSAFLEWAKFTGTASSSRPGRFPTWDCTGEWAQHPRLSRPSTCFSCGRDEMDRPASARGGNWYGTPSRQCAA